MTGQKKHGGWGEKNTWFEKGCVSLAFFLSAVLILLFGIRIAGNTIQVAQAEKIEIINNLVEGLSAVSYTHLDVYKRQQCLCQLGFSGAESDSSAGSRNELP